MTLNGQKLREARKAKSISQAALSRLVGCDVKTIYNAENDRHPPNSDTIARIAAQLGVTIDSLYDRTEIPA